MKVGIVSLGCCKNLVDTQKAMSFLKASGHSFVNDPKKAEVILINTCGFINDAKQESIDTILQMADYKTDRLKYLIVMGCLVQRYKKQLEKELPEVDLFITIDEYSDLAKILNDFLNSKTIKENKVVLATSDYSAYLKIADGCSNKCAYCAIPLIRKEYRSIKFEEIIRQAKELEEIGVKELNLIAQDTTRYGIDLYGKYRLADLLYELNKMNFTWIRILYMYPDEINDDLLEAMGNCDRVVPYFDIPVQHASDRMLKLMNRRGSKKHIIERVKKIREKFENPILRTTIIVGFPTETDEEFQELLEFIQEIKWNKLGAFTYSLEEDTASYNMEPKVDEKVANKRLEKLMLLQEKIAQENNEKYIGKTLDVLVEGRDSLDKRLYQGRSYGNAPDGIDGHVRFTSSRDIEIGEFAAVKIENVNVHDLFGKEVI
ncbi:MAG: 30S ribosomal protein S12 methylthiotransferase RimO [Erysipelotrichia bacterium]|jgi:ribosomal protein S12 methylthiotransferase|nr:30S ribosomal protein S12 methylthiotransferase RimO [Erysipelotrichia bacterium]